MFNSDQYEIRQKLMSFGNKYTVYENGEQILDSGQKKLKLKEDFRFKDADGNPVLKVTTDQILDVAASYTVVDERTDETVGALQRNFTFFSHEWEIIDSNNKVVGTLTEDNMIMALARRFVSELLPFRYKIVSQQGKKLGTLNGQFSLRDKYTLDLSDDDEKELDRRLGVAAAVLIDAIEGN
jgi:uncharacterized protein YxjI